MFDFIFYSFIIKDVFLMYLSGKYKSNVRFSLLVMRFELGQTQSSDWIEIVNHGTQHFFNWVGFTVGLESSFFSCVNIISVSEYCTQHFV